VGHDETKPSSGGLSFRNNHRRPAAVLQRGTIHLSHAHRKVWKRDDRDPTLPANIYEGIEADRQKIKELQKELDELRWDKVCGRENENEELVILQEWCKYHSISLVS